MVAAVGEAAVEWQRRQLTRERNRGDKVGERGLGLGIRFSLCYFIFTSTQ